MGFMVGDLNGDAIPEIYFGNGGPNLPQPDDFLVSDGTLTAAGSPNYFDATSVFDFPAPQHPDAPAGYYPEYPYRTHGTTFVDTDNDGVLEINTGRERWNGSLAGYRTRTESTFCIAVERRKLLCRSTHR